MKAGFILEICYDIIPSHLIRKHIETITAMFHKYNTYLNYIVAIIVFLSASTTCFAQDRPDWHVLLPLVMTIDDAESDAWEDNTELWDELSQHPIDLNSATKEDLERIYFLSDEQIEDILAYVYQYGPMRSTNELAMIESIDGDMRRLLQCFVTTEEHQKSGFPKLNDIAKWGKHDLTVTAKIPCYERHGYKSGYLGDPYIHSFRYVFNYSNNIKLGLIGAQDAGEPFFAGTNKKGYDYYSFFASLSNIGKLKKLVIGRYRTTFGMGLVVNNNLAFGKLMSLTSLGRRRNAITEHTSRSESNYLQGIAASYEIIDNLTVSAFASYRYIDATLTPDNENTIRTILTTGYHRTESEIKRRHNAKEGLIGANITYKYNGWQFGFTSLYNKYSMPLQPDTRQKYRRWYPEGKSFWNIGIDYGYRNYRFSFQGETATGSSGSIATVNRLTFEATSALSLIALQRFYGYKYVATHAQSFSDGGRVQNESGFYVGTEWRPIPIININGYIDVARFAWPKYQADFTSMSYDAMLQAVLRLKNWTVFARYSLRDKEKNNKSKSALVDDRTHRIRLSATAMYEKFSARTQLDAAMNDYKNRSKGWMISEHLSMQIIKQLQLSLSAAYFNTDDYQSRLYCYEPGLLYQLSFHSFHGNGIHISTHIKSAITDNLMVIARLSYNNYFDRDHISSGLQQIDASHQTDLEMQIRWKF